MSKPNESCPVKTETKKSGKRALSIGNSEKEVGWSFITEGTQEEDQPTREELVKSVEGTKTIKQNIHRDHSYTVNINIQNLDPLGLD